MQYSYLLYICIMKHQMFEIKIQQDMAWMIASPSGYRIHNQSLTKNLNFAFTVSNMSVYFQEY